MKILEAQKLRHYYQGEDLERPVTVELAKLDEDDESTMAYQVTIQHPKIAKTGRNEERAQAPEIFRFMDEQAARVAWRCYVRTLGGDAPEPAVTKGGVVDLSPLLARLAKLEEKNAKLEKAIADIEPE